MLLYNCKVAGRGGRTTAFDLNIKRECNKFKCVSYAKISIRITFAYILLKQRLLLLLLLFRLIQWKDIAKARYNNSTN